MVQRKKKDGKDKVIVRKNIAHNSTVVIRVAVWDDMQLH
jgi:hypothetical protein